MYFSQKAFWNVSAKSFRSTCERVESLKNLYYRWTFSQVIFKVSVEYFFTYLQKPFCVLYSRHILYLYSYLYKVLLPPFTIPEMESERKISLSFWITAATSYRCALGAGKVKPFFCINFVTQEIWIIFLLKAMFLSYRNNLLGFYMMVKLAANA